MNSIIVTNGNVIDTEYEVSLAEVRSGVKIPDNNGNTIEINPEQVSHIIIRPDNQ